MWEMQFVAKDLHGHILCSVLNVLTKTAGHGDINPIEKVNSGIQFRGEGFRCCLLQAQTHIMSSAVQ